MKQFKILHRENKARVGELTTLHGVIETPEFIPVGTKASVKAISPRELKEVGAQVVLANTYHLMLRPGADLIEKLGGLHKFMSWDKPIMTDSGGFQVFSLGMGLESGESKVWRKGERVKACLPAGRQGEGEREVKPRLAKVTEEGVFFQSHLDGDKYFLGPKESIKIQYQLRADLIVAFDDHESITMTKQEIQKSLELTENWGLRSLEVAKLLKSKQLMYGVIHGALHKDLRIKSAEFTDKYFDAIAIGGIYGQRKEMYQMIDWVIPNVSDEKVRHLLGIGEVEDLFNGVEKGMDLFDCVAPTRRARNASIYISPENGGKVSNHFTLNLTSAKYKQDNKSLDPGCICYTCQNFTKAYLRYLYLSEEILYHQLATIHNVYFILNLMKKIREAIKVNNFYKLKEKYL